MIKILDISLSLGINKISDLKSVSQLPFVSYISEITRSHKLFMGLLGI